MNECLYYHAISRDKLSINKTGSTIPSVSSRVILARSLRRCDATELAAVSLEWYNSSQGNRMIISCIRCIKSEPQRSRAQWDLGRFEGPQRCEAYPTYWTSSKQLISGWHLSKRSNIVVSRVLGRFIMVEWEDFAFKLVFAEIFCPLWLTSTASTAISVFRSASFAGAESVSLSVDVSSTLTSTLCQSAAFSHVLAGRSFEDIIRTGNEFLLGFGYNFATVKTCETYQLHLFPFS